MNKPKNHKHLSAEELFKLLEKKSNTENDYDKFDDFEKEALQGFAENTNSEKGKRLNEEINSAITKKIAQPKITITKDKIIWFSAAASIVLLICLSVFFFNNSKNDTQSNIALNDLSDTKIADQISIQPITELPINADSVNEDSNVLSDESSNLTNKKSESKTNSVNELEKETRKDKTQNEFISSDVKNSNEEIVFENIMQSKNENNSKDADSPTGESIAKDVASVFKQQQNQKEIDSKKSVGKAKIEETISLSNSMAAPVVSDIAINSSSANYPGNEKAIQDFVVAYVKSKNKSTLLVGKYKVSAIVFANGTLKVNSIIQITKEFCGCTDNITEALNAMKMWDSALINGSKQQSEVDFTINF